LGEALVLVTTTVAFAVTAVFMIALRPVANGIGLVDRPGGRKFHDGEIPIIGGIAMFGGVFVGMSLVPLLSAVLFSVFIASMLLVIIGVLDDRFHLSSTVRLATQVAAVLLMVYGAGLPLADIGDPFGTGIISMGPFTLIFTTLVTLTMINSYNFVDGADGLAGSMTLIALLSVSVVSGLYHPATVAALTVSAAIVGFLIFNFPTPLNRSVRSFMGDAGSTLLGFTVVWITLSVSQGPDRMISPVYCLWFAAIPIFDCLTCFVRRALNGKSPFAPGRDHFHHILLRGGFKVRQTLGILTGLQLAYALIALAGHFTGVPDFMMFAGWSVLGLTQRLVIRKISRYRRFVLVRRVRVRVRLIAATVGN